MKYASKLFFCQHFIQYRLSHNIRVAENQLQFAAVLLYLNVTTAQNREPDISEDYIEVPLTSYVSGSLVDNIIGNTSEEERRSHIIIPNVMTAYD